MGVVRRLLLLAIISVVFTVYSAVAVSAAPATYDSGQCVINNDPGFDQALNWQPDVVPTKPTDFLDFSLPHLGGACTNHPDDDITVPFSNSCWDGMDVLTPFDDMVLLRADGSCSSPYGTVDLHFATQGLRIDTGNAAYGIRIFTATPNDAIAVEGNMNLWSGLIDANSLDMSYLVGGNVDIRDGITTGGTGYEGCGNQDTGRYGIFMQNNIGTISLKGDEFWGCAYAGPDRLAPNSMTIDAEAAHTWNHDMATNSWFELINITATWTSQSPSDYQIRTLASGTGFRTESATIAPDAGNPSRDLDWYNNQTFIFNRSNIEVSVLWNGETGFLSINDTNITLTDIFFDQGSTHWDNLSPLDIDTQFGGVGFNFNATGSSNNYDFRHINITGSNKATFASSSLVESKQLLDLPLTDVNLIGTATWGTNDEMRVRNIHVSGASGWNMIRNLTFSNITFDSGSPFTVSGEGYLDGKYWWDLDQASGSIGSSGGVSRINYTNITYDTLPALSASTYSLNVGGNPHYVRGHTVPAEGSTVIVGNRSFEWTEEWGVDSYECQLDQTADSFASPEKTWTSTSNSEYVNLADIPNSTDYQWRCRTQKADTEGNTQYSGWSTPASFFYLYAFQNVCGNGTFAIDLFTANTIPVGTTPVNRTLDSKISTPINFATYNVSSPIHYNLTYNDSVFNVIDPATISSFTNSTAVLILNSHTYDSPLDDTIYTVDIKASNSDGDLCNLTYRYSVGAVGATNLQSSSALLLTGAVFVILTGIFLWFGRRVGLKDPERPEGMEGQGGFMGGW